VNSDHHGHAVVCVVIGCDRPAHEHTETHTARCLDCHAFTDITPSAPKPTARRPKSYRRPADTVMCLHCAEPTEQHPDGRSRKFCSTRCRVAAHRAANRSAQNAGAEQEAQNTESEEGSTEPGDAPHSADRRRTEGTSGPAAVSAET